MQSKNEVIVRDLGVGCGVLVRQEGEQSGIEETLQHQCEVQLFENKTKRMIGKKSRSPVWVSVRFASFISKIGSPQRSA